MTQSAARASQSLQAAQNPDALLKIQTVSDVTGLSGPSIYRKVRADPPQFPAPVKDGTRCTRWVAGQVTAWLRARAGQAV